MSYVYNNFKTVNVKAGSQVTGSKTSRPTMPRKDGKLALTQGVKLWIRNDQVASNVQSTTTLKKQVVKNKALEAPLPRTRSLGPPTFP